MGNNARVIYTPDAAGTYYVEEYFETGEVNRTYMLSVILLGANGASEADTDFPATTATTGRVEVGASAMGNIGTDGDADWFRVDLEAGKTYQFEVEGAGTGQGTLEDASLNLYDDIGEFAPGSGFTDLDNDLDNRFIYSVTTAGIYYVEVHGSSGTGTSTLSVRDITQPPDDPPGDSGNVSEGDTDLPADTTTTGQVEVGGSVTGNIGSSDDADYFRVVLEAGTRYQIDLEGADTGRGTLADPA